MKYSNFIIVSILAMMSCKAQNNSQLPVETAKQVDLSKYTGIWYEISTIPAHFQKGCRCTTAEYQLDPSGYIRVTNRCVADGKFKKIEGKAFVVKNTGNARLKVQFFWPFKGDYRIVELADDYSWAAVGSQSRKYLWVLSRNPVMADSLYNQIVAQLEKKGFITSSLVKTAQDCK